MNTVTKFFALLMLFSVYTCSNEPIENDNGQATDIYNASVSTTSNNTNSDNSNSNNTDSDSDSDDEHCVSTSLIAGQHHDAGSVTIDIEDGNLIVTYTVTEDWTIGTTHLSIGDCDSEWIHLTGSGNPQIGQFEFTEPSYITEHEVVYIIPFPEGDENENYCFSAHAEVEGPDGGETAWAEGQQFSGNSWAMYDEFNTSDCTSSGTGGPPY